MLPWLRADRRRRSRRAVSPVVATILLVAITVVLAAVLYVTVGGLVRGPGQTPLASTFAFGTPTNVTSASAAPGCPAGVECYSLAVATAGDGLTASAVEFGAMTNAGATVSVSGWTFTLVGPSGNPLNASWAGGARCAGTGCPLLLTGGDVLMISTGGSASLANDKVVGVGNGAFSGTVASFLFPR